MMESDRTNSTPSDGGTDGLQRMRSLHGRTSGPTRRSTKGQWTAEEDDILCKAVQRFKGKNWKKIAECFKDRTDVQCLHRWQKVLNPELVKGPWSKGEDEIIVELVDKYGPKKWSTIAQHLPGRIGKQCRERWHNHLNPNISKEAWTQEEELTLISAHQIYGNKWAELTKFLPGSLLCRKMDEKKEFVDLSSMMLFEATGDSEAISELNIAAVNAELMGAAEDDALSCSCDDLMDCELGKFDGLGHTHVKVYHVADHGDEEEEDIDQDWTDGGDDEVVMSSTAKAREHKKLRVCVDSAMELMNEVVMSILFPAALFLIFSIVNI